MARVEVTHQSWLSRLFGSFVGVLFGLAMFVGAYPLLFWNEGRAVRRAQSLAEGAGAVISVAADRVDAANDGRLVHVTGSAAADGELRDPEFGVSAAAIRLRRSAEMYQWKETSKSETRNKLGGGTETVTVYDYEKAWDSSAISSSSFKEPEGHRNPGEMAVSSASWTAPIVTLGAFTLTTDQVSELSGDVPLPITEAALEALPSDLRAAARIHDGGYYIGESPASPAIGDLRIRYEIVPPGPVSIVARQDGQSFAPFMTEAGSPISLVAAGTHSAAGMFQTAQTENTIVTWLLRAGGFLLMFVGLTLIFQPLRVLGDVVPIVGRIIGGGIGVASALIALALSSITIALAWVVYRPLLGLTLLAVGIGAIALVLRRAKKQPAVVVPPPIPPPIPAA